jgi:hypothetical protein
MRFSSILIAAMAAVASANTVEFVSQDSVDRTIIFTAQEGLAPIKSLELKGLGNGTVEFPHGWIGNFYSVSKGQPDVPGMLGEVRWNGWEGINFFDISAIVNKDDIHGIKTLAPKNAGKPVSGCESYEEVCKLAYYLPDDVQTQSTKETELICTVGTKATNMLARRHQRHFVTGHSRH